MFLCRLFHIRKYAKFADVSQQTLTDIAMNTRKTKKKDCTIKDADRRLNEDTIIDGHNSEKRISESILCVFSVKKMGISHLLQKYIT